MEPPPYAATHEDVLAARARIAAHVHATPLLTCSAISALASAAAARPLELLLKCELFQRSGSFKMRGAANAVMSLSPAESARGVCTHSSGNHAQALALAASLRAGCPAFIVMPSNAPAVKKAATAGYGASVIECEPTQAAREAAAAAAAARTGAAFVHPSEDPRVIAGQGTLALELLEQARALDAVIVPVGGGGLISGVALALRGSGVLVVGAEPAAADDAARSKAAGARQGHAGGGAAPATVADGLKTTLGANTWPIVRDLVADIVCVSEAEIRAALRLVYARAKLAIEPSAAVGVAAALSADFGAVLRARLPEAAARAQRPLRVGIVLCGGNADVEVLVQCLREEA